jgi:hypothetical protein
VMNIYEGNDLRDAIRYWGHADPSQRGEAASLDRRPRASVDNALGRHSYAYNLLAVTLAKVESAGARALDSALGRDSRREANLRYRVRFADREVAFNSSNFDSDEADYAFALFEGRIDLAVFDAALRSFVELSREHGFLPVVAYSPSAHTVYVEQIRFEDLEVAASLAAYSGALRAYFARAADEMGFVFVDATAALQAVAETSKSADVLYFPTNLHYTPDGHRVFAEYVARALLGLPGAQ